MEEELGLTKVPMGMEQTRVICQVNHLLERISQMDRELTKTHHLKYQYLSKFRTYQPHLLKLLMEILKVMVYSDAFWIGNMEN